MESKALSKILLSIFILYLFIFYLMLINLEYFFQYKSTFVIISSVFTSLFVLICYYTTLIYYIYKLRDPLKKVNRYNM